MQLWTWQNKAFNLSDPTQRVRPLDCSVYITHPDLDSDGKDKHKKASEKVFARVGTDQLIWCFHRYEDAVSNASIVEFETLGRVLWEIDVPCEKIRWHCHAAWTCLRTGKPDLPDRIRQIYKELKYFRADCAKRFEDDFTAHWRDKNDDELLDLLFLNRLVTGCSGAIVFHPVDTIVKNPLMLGKWWSEQRPQPTGALIRHNDVPLPCRNCPARGLC